MHILICFVTQIKYVSQTLQMVRPFAYRSGL